MKPATPGTWRSLPRQGEVLAEKYRIERLLGRGGMGTVFLAENLGTGKQVALKWLDSAGIGDEKVRLRFQHEARAAGRIHHPHVIDVYDVSEHDGNPFLVMEYLRGRSLQQALDAEGRVSPAQILEWLIPAMEGVSAAHALGVIHRDLKPDNIFLCERPDGSSHTKVLDFGVAKTLSAASSESHSLTRPGALLGSPAYMAVEQLDALEVDARVDVYAFGIILYRALCGVLPYESPSLSKLIAEIGAGAAKPLRQHRPELSSILEAIVARAMACDAAQRFDSVNELRLALLPFREAAMVRKSSEVLALPVRATPRPLGERVLSVVRARLSWIAATSALALGAFVATAVDEPPDNASDALATDTSDSAHVSVQEDAPKTSEGVLSQMSLLEPPLSKAPEPRLREQPLDTHQGEGRVAPPPAKPLVARDPSSALPGNLARPSKKRPVTGTPKMMMLPGPKQEVSSEAKKSVAGYEPPLL